MPRRLAIDIALDAAAKPATLSLLAVGPLPEGLKDVLRIVADGEWRAPSTEEAYRGHSPEAIREACAAFLRVVLFEKASTPHRVLGLGAGASEDDVRENKRLLLKWLHPDRNAHPGDRALLARVIEAAEALEQGRGTLGGAPGAAPQRGAQSPQPRATPHRPARAAPPRAATKPPAAARQAAAARRAAPASQGRYVVARGLGLVARLTKLTAVTAIVGLGGLLAWRLTMHEPIGASLARYSKMALGAVAW